MEPTYKLFNILCSDYPSHAGRERFSGRGSPKARTAGSPGVFVQQKYIMFKSRLCLQSRVQSIDEIYTEDPTRGTRRISMVLKRKHGLDVARGKIRKIDA
ncbi:MAG: transposase [Fibrobacter sp.]|nr:transposase [Fibrobacter sp.]